MNSSLSLIVDERVPGEIRGIVESLLTKGIKVYNRSALSSMHESGNVFCIITNQAAQWNLNRPANTKENDWILAGFQGNKLLFAQKAAIEKSYDSRRLYGQILWELFSAEFASYFKGSVSAFLDLIRAGMLVFNIDGDLLFANNEVENLTGWPVDELARKPAGEFLRFKSILHEQSIDLQGLFKEPQKIGSLEFLFRGGGWHTLFFHSYVLPAPVAGDELLILITGSHNSAEGEEIFNRLDRMHERAILHDFRNLLQGVVTYIDLLGFEIATGSAASGYLDKMRAELRRGQEILRQLMYPEPVSEPELSIDQMLENLISTLREIIPSNISLVFQGACPDAVSISPVDLGRVVRNLVKNAVEAMGASPGVIRVQTSNASLSELQSEYKEYARITISDTGPGIPQHLQDKIFEPFITSRQGQGGTGLGLYSVYTTIKQYKGQIHFESEPHKGTTFVIFLPLTKK